MIEGPIKQLENNDRQFSPGLQFLIFCFLFILLYISTNLIALGIVYWGLGEKAYLAFTSLNVSSPNFVKAFWIVQILGTTFPIFAAPTFFAYRIVRDPKDYIKPTFHFHWTLIVLVVAIMFGSTPLIEILSNINQKMPLPQSLKWMRTFEDAAQKTTGAILNMKTLWDVIVNVLVIGLLTAIVEEFMFRGVIQTIFARWTKNTHAAVWITAILFSAFHMEFFGFLPRLFLGVLFGYFVAWSGSIWAGVWAHFINNSTAVIVTWLYQKKMININPDDEHMFNYQGYTISLIIVLVLLFVYHYVSNKKTIPEY